MLALLSLFSVAAAATFRVPTFGQQAPVRPQAPPISQPVSGYGQVQAPPTPVRQDCVLSDYVLSPCSATCGGGYQERRRTVIQHATGYGTPCPTNLVEAVTCNTHPCAVDCVVQQGQYSECSATCGVGYRTKTDSILVQASNGGLACPLPSQLSTQVQCSLPACPIPVDCEIGYSEYTACSAPCGGGVHTRHAFVIRQAENGGAPCPADLGKFSDTKACNVEIPCATPHNCEYRTSGWGECSSLCGAGVQKRQIFIVAQPQNGGEPCPTELVQTRPCNSGPCPIPGDCLVEYSPWTYCSATCGGGTQSSQGRVVRQATKGGAPCPSYADLNILRSCNTAPCFSLTARDCQVEYGAYSACSAACGQGYQYRKAYVINEAEHGGLPCPSPDQLTERATCNLGACAPPLDCVVQPGYWGACSATCGGGFQTRTSTITQYPQNGGRACPTNLQETRPCNTEPCQLAPPTYGQVPPQTPPTYGQVPPQTPPTYGQVPPQAPPTYGQVPPQAPPTYGQVPPQAPPTYGQSFSQGHLNQASLTNQVNQFVNRPRPNQGQQLVDNRQFSVGNPFLVRSQVVNTAPAQSPVSVNGANQQIATSFDPTYGARIVNPVL